MDSKPVECSPQVVRPLPDARDPEDRLVPPTTECIREKMLDKTLADTFPTSDPPSSIPDPSADDSFATGEEKRREQELCAEKVKPGREAA
jgi:hypothetical protein